MALPALESTDLKNKLEDLSGVTVKPGENPYRALIAAADDDPAKIQALYAAHRATRNAQQRAKFLAPDFHELIIDPFLLRIENPSLDPTFEDPRHGLVFWARPPEHILRLAGHVQQLLQRAAPHIWLMPLHCMHMTALEMMHSRTPEESDKIVRAMATALIPAPGDAGTGRDISAAASASTSTSTSTNLVSGIAAIVNYTHHPGHRARLVKPMLSYDLAAVALSFVPATVAEPSTSPPPVPPALSSSSSSSSSFTYHHLRRDLFECARQTGVDPASRYVVPSAHITLARFLGQQDHDTAAARRAWVQAIDDINAWLERDVWDAPWQPQPSLSSSSSSLPPPPPPSRRFVGEWIVGQERGLDARTGALWYGGGRTVMVGEGF